MSNIYSYIIANEGTTEPNSITQILKKFPITYPKEMYEFQFTLDGKFEKSVKTTVHNFFQTSGWTKRFNEILSLLLETKKYNQKIIAYCERYGYKISDFKIDLIDAYFSEYTKDVRTNQLYINISFHNIDRYDAPGFQQLMNPILTYIVKNDIGNNWFVENGEYPTDFIICRPLSNAESNALKKIHDLNEAKKKEKAEKNSIARKKYAEKVSKKVELENYLNSNKFYGKSLREQAFEIVNFFTLDKKYYYDRYTLSNMNNIFSKLESMKENEGEKIFKFKYERKNAFDIFGKPVTIPLTCYVVTKNDSDYKKLDKVYFLDYENIRSETFNTYIKKKVLSGK